MKNLQFYNIMMGCDPEFFFSKNGEICGSEKVISKDGIQLSGVDRIIVDGVQAELNPTPSTCRQSLSYGISKCFKELYTRISGDNSLKVDFSEVIKVSKEELNSLSNESRQFGCAPSLNIYEGENSKINVNPEKYLYRSAGGHIHLGVGHVYLNNMANQNINMTLYFRKELDLEKMGCNRVKFKYPGFSIHSIKHEEKIILNKELMRHFNVLRSEWVWVIKEHGEIFQQYEKLIPLLDIIVGNTCVLLDRNEMAKERRKVYGKAGEFRLTPYGVEYRVLSNFWLKSYPLMSLVFGLARLATNILANGQDCYSLFLKAVSKDDIEKAINENDFDLAYKNFKKIENIIKEITYGTAQTFSLNLDNLDDFHFFVKKGMNYWFKENPLEHWLTFYNQREKYRGWESYAYNIVHEERINE